MSKQPVVRLQWLSRWQSWDHVDRSHLVLRRQPCLGRDLARASGSPRPVRLMPTKHPYIPPRCRPSRFRSELIRDSPTIGSVIVGCLPQSSDDPRDERDVEHPGRRVHELSDHDAAVPSSLVASMVATTPLRMFPPCRGQLGLTSHGPLRGASAIRRNTASTSREGASVLAR